MKTVQTKKLVFPGKKCEIKLDSDYEGKINYFNLWNFEMIITFIFLVHFLVVPLINVLKASFIDLDTSKLGLSNYGIIFSKKYYYGALLNSIKVCTLATIFATLIGDLMAYIVTRYNIPYKSFMYILIILSLLMPPFIGAYSWIILLGRNGIIVRNLAKIGIQKITAPLMIKGTASGAVLSWVTTIISILIVNKLSGGKGFNIN